MAVGVGEVLGLRAEVARVTGALDPALFATAGAVAVLEQLVSMRNVLSAAEAVFAARVAQTDQWRRCGHRSPEEWLAAKTGTSTPQAAQQLAVGQRLGDQPVLTSALRAGVLSAEQARLVSDAAAADPAAERHLVETAGRGSLGELRDTCQRVKAAADRDPDATHGRIRAARRVRRWTDTEGGWNLQGRTVAEDGAEVNAALDAIADELFTKARLAGRVEPREAYLADALVELARRHNRGIVTTEPPGARTRRARAKPYLALLRVDVAALQRGAVDGGERCEIAGVGPVPLAVARRILGEATLKLVLTRGVDVANLTHLGRGPTVAQRCAMLWTDPHCIVEGCTQLWQEADHRVDFALSRHTTLGEMDGYCGHHHDQKTYFGWALVGGAGRRPMVPPDDPRHPAHANATDPDPPPPDEGEPFDDTLFR